MPTHAKERAKTTSATYVIGGKSYEVPAASVCSGISIKPVYTPDDVADLDYDRDLGDPGSFPYTRGVYPTMYRSHLWTFREYAGFGTGAETNERFKQLLAGGGLGLSLAFDLPTQLGQDSDDVRAEYDVGRVGVAVDTIEDFREVFADIDLGEISTSFTINAPANIILAMYLVLAEERGVPWSGLRGTIQNDPLKEYVARGNYIWPPRESVRLACDAIEFALENMPKFNAISINSTHIKEAGATNTFSIAAAFQNGITYIEELRRRGYHLDDYGLNLSFNLFGDMEFFENICQQRAARRLWAHLARDRFGATSPRAMQMRYVGGAGSGTSLTAAHPLLNIARLGFHCLMQVLGGTQAVALQSYDEAFEIPTEESAKLSLLIQAMIAYELGITDTADPLGGSYLVESLTNDLEAKIREQMEEIDSWGGAVEAIESGKLQSEIARQSYEWIRRVESGEDIVIGQNMFLPDEDDEPGIATFEFDRTTRERQLARLEKVKARRDGAAVLAALDGLTHALVNEQNTIPPLIDCVRAEATIGEMCARITDELGEYRTPDF